jgi:hypothetical protein
MFVSGQYLLCIEFSSVCKPYAIGRPTHAGVDKNLRELLTTTLNGAELSSLHRGKAVSCAGSRTVWYEMVRRDSKAPTGNRTASPGLQCKAGCMRE